MSKIYDVYVYKNGKTWEILYPAKKYIGAFRSLSTVNSFLKPAIAAGMSIEWPKDRVKKNPAKKYYIISRYKYQPDTTWAIDQDDVVKELLINKIKEYKITYPNRVFKIVSDKIVRQYTGGLSNPPSSKQTKIYDTLLEIRAKKGPNSLWPGELFKHAFSKKSKAQVLGNPDGSLTIKSAVGKKLWRRFDY